MAFRGGGEEIEDMEMVIRSFLAGGRSGERV